MCNRRCGWLLLLCRRRPMATYDGRRLWGAPTTALSRGSMLLTARADVNLAAARPAPVLGLLRSTTPVADGALRGVKNERRGLSPHGHTPLTTPIFSLHRLRTPTLAHAQPALGGTPAVMRRAYRLIAHTNVHPPLQPHPSGPAQSEADKSLGCLDSAVIEAARSQFEGHISRRDPSSRPDRRPRRGPTTTTTPTAPTPSRRPSTSTRTPRRAACRRPRRRRTSAARFSAALLGL